MAEDMERLTNNSAILTSSDLIYVSRIMKKIAQSPRVTTKVTAESAKLGFYIIKCADKIPKSNIKLVYFCFLTDQQKNAENYQ